MKVSQFFGKLFSGYLWGNLFAMAMVVVLLCFGVKYGIDFYTHHGESIPVPDIKHKKFSDAERILDDAGLRIEVSDTGYVKTLPPDVVLEQSVKPGERVKGGRVIYVTINALNTPTLTLPDIIDNSSLREAMAKLTAMGFKVGMPQFVPGEKDWVYGVLVKGKHVAAGDKISIEDSVYIQVGNGMRDMTDSVNYIDPELPEFEDLDEFDDFEPVTSGSSSTEPEPSQEQKEGASSASSTKTEESKPATPKPATPASESQKPTATKPAATKPAESASVGATKK